MDTSQTRIIELLREVHLIAFKEIERLNLRIAELENREIQPPQLPVVTTSEKRTQIEIMNERQLALYLNISIAALHRWRLLRKGPKFMKIGRAVRYRLEDVSSWLQSCHGMQ